MRKARDALRAEDRARYEHMRDLARFYAQRAMSDFQHPFMAAKAQANDRLAADAKKGAKATAKKFARPELDQLIRGCLERGEGTRNHTKEWADRGSAQQTFNGPQRQGAGRRDPTWGRRLAEVGEECRARWREYSNCRLLRQVLAFDM